VAEWLYEFEWWLWWLKGGWKEVVNDEVSQFIRTTGSTFHFQARYWVNLKAHSTEYTHQRPTAIYFCFPMLHRGSKLITAFNSRARYIVIRKVFAELQCLKHHTSKPQHLLIYQNWSFWEARSHQSVLYFTHQASYPYFRHALRESPKNARYSQCIMQKKWNEQESCFRPKRNASPIRYNLD